MRIHGWTSSPILLARVAVFGALVAGALAGCGGGASAGGAMSAAAGPNAPLAIGQGNATATAAEAIVTPATLAETATTAAGASAAPAAVPPALSSIDRRVVQRWFSSQNVSPTAAGTVTIPCAVGGSFTAVTSADGKTLTVTFADCSEVAGTSVGGTQTYTNLTLTTQSTLDSISANVTDALTIVVGTVSYAETGDYAFSFSASKTAGGGVSTATFGLTGSSLSISVSKGGAVSDSVTLTNFDFNFEEDRTVSPHQLYSSFNYTLASSKLNGKITVATTREFKQIVDPAETHLYPYAGQLMIEGANSVRLQVTILGDETFVPPMGEGQIELQLDSGTGSFGPAIWLSWATLTAG
ncbi:MAG TPA: hypothetical protein VF917_03310 [Steroidobacteraceae bacterium]